MRQDAEHECTWVRIALLLALASCDAERPQSVIEGWAGTYTVLSLKLPKQPVMHRPAIQYMPILRFHRDLAKKPIF